MSAHVIRWRRVRVFAGRSFAALGVCAVPLGVLTPVSPNWWDGKWWVIPVVLVAAAGWGLWGFRRQNPVQFYSRDGFTIRLIVGDIFKQDASVMIGMTTTFDTDTNLGIIAETSLQANFVKAIYGGRVDLFDQALADALSRRNITPVGHITKAGKQDVYPLSTVVTIKLPSGVSYHCVAYTEMNAANVAAGSIDGVLDSLNSTWSAVNEHGNGAPICVPLIGQGRARIQELSPEIAIRLIAFSFLLRTRRGGRFSDELRIVVHPSERTKIDAMEFQAFLSSLLAA